MTDNKRLTSEKYSYIMGFIIKNKGVIVWRTREQDRWRQLG